MSASPTPKFAQMKHRLVTVVIAGSLAVTFALPAAVGPARRAAGLPGCHPSWPVVAYHAGGSVIHRPAGAAGASLPVACAFETGYATSESTIAVTGNGTLVYSPAETENSMARSVNQGISWQLTYPATEQYTSFWNTVDPYVTADWRTGRVFWAHATGPVRTEGSLPGNAGFLLAAAYGFQVYTSANNGQTWTTANYSTQPTGDWEKLSVGPPPPAATGAPQPSGYPDIIYLCANSPVEVVGPGRLCYKSLDGGTTFTIAGYVTPSATQPVDNCPPLDFNAGVVGNHGTLYQPATCLRGAYLAVSHNEGASYTWIPVPGAPPGPTFGGNYLQIAVDHADNLYALWPSASGLDLAVSRDHGLVWTKPMEVAAPGTHNIKFPALAAGASGNVAITYYASTTASAKYLNGYITQTTDALTPHPLFFGGVINNPAVPILYDYSLTNSPRVDFIGGAYDPQGTTFWAGVVKQFGPPDASGTIRTVGYVGRLLFQSAAPTHR